MSEDRPERTWWGRWGAQTVGAALLALLSGVILLDMQSERQIARDAKLAQAEADKEQGQRIETLVQGQSELSKSIELQGVQVKNLADSVATLAETIGGMRHTDNEYGTKIKELEGLLRELSNLTQSLRADIRTFEEREREAARERAVLEARIKALEGDRG